MVFWPADNVMDVKARFPAMLDRLEANIKEAGAQSDDMLQFSALRSANNRRTIPSQVSSKPSLRRSRDSRLWASSL